MKILILMTYYNRPLLVHNALQGVLKANEQHEDWHLVFGDDGSKIPGAPIVEEVMKDHMHKVTLVNTKMTFEDKLAQGIALGRFANDVIKNSDADIGIITGDDDVLHPYYLHNLDKFFTNNPDVLYCYSCLVMYNPLYVKAEDCGKGKYALWNKYNQHGSPINPAGKVDATQVAWRLSCCKEHGAWFPDSTKLVQGRPWTRDTDIQFFEALFVKCGPCPRTEFVCQYKGIHDYQLLWNKNYGPDDLKAYDDMLCELAGVKF